MKKQFAGKNSHILVFIGPSGVGKSTIVSEIHEKGLVSLNPTWTTRASRPGETSGIEHVFVSETELQNAKKYGTFLDVVQLFGLPHIYGQPRVEIVPGKVPSMMLRVGVLGRLRQHYTNVTIYQIEDSLENVEKRLQKRADDGEKIGTRLEDYKIEISKGRELASRVFVNVDLEEITKKISDAISEDFSEYHS